MARYCNHYECPCGHQWQDEWDCTCDDRCPVCDTSCSPSSSYDLDSPEEVKELKQNHDYETFEEHQARMKRIRDEAKAETEVKRYIHALTIDTEVKHWPSKFIPEGLFKETFRKLYMSEFSPGMDEILSIHSKRDMETFTLDSLYMPTRRPVPSIIRDECHYIEPKDMWLRSEPKEKDWDQKMFKSGPPTSPSEAVRQKRREERNRKKKKK